MTKINPQENIIETKPRFHARVTLYKESRSEIINQLTTKGELWLFTLLEDLKKESWILTSAFVDKTDRNSYDTFRKATNSFIEKGFLVKVIPGFFMKKGPFADLADILNNSFQETN